MVARSGGRVWENEYMGEREWEVQTSSCGMDKSQGMRGTG